MNLFYLYLYPSISMAYNVISCRKIAKNAQILKLLNSQYKLGSRAQKSPKYTQKNFAINRDLLNFFCIGRVYIALHILNPHVQTAKGGRESLRPSYKTFISREQKNTFGGVCQNYLATLLILEQNPSEKIF